jgi:pimeloyl-ACP methyl ester carboxylesterase
VRNLLVASVLGLTLASACGGSDEEAGTPSSAATPTQEGGVVDVGGYDLAYLCRGEGEPTVILDAGLGTGGTSAYFDFIDLLDPIDTRVCTYDRTGTGTSEPRPRSAGTPTGELEAEELHALLEAAEIAPPYVLAPHSYAGLIARVFADRYPEEVAGFVFEDVSTAWEIDLWPKWDPSPWIDGRQRVDIQTTERQVLDAAPLGSRPTVVVSQDTYDEEGIPAWAAPIFAKQQSRLASLGDDVVHVRADGVGHFIHDDAPQIMVDAIAAVVDAVRSGQGLPTCEEIFDPSDVTCVT